MNATDQRLAAWCGLIFTALFGIGLTVAGWLPLPGPSMTVDEVVAMYQGNTFGIRAGMVIMMLAAAFFFAMTAVTSHQMTRIRGISRTLPFLQIIAGTANAVTFFLAPVFFALAAFRPDRDPQVLYALNDLGWLVFIAPISAATFQNLAIAIAIFMDRGPKPVFPRWFGFLNLWAAIIYLPGGLAFFMKTGPFAWNGLLAFYVPAFAFFGWIVSLVVLLLKAIKEEEQGTVTAAAPFADRAVGVGR